MAPADNDADLNADKVTTSGDDGWTENRDQNRRSSRSRSPGANKEDTANQGNNLHVSGLSRKVEAHDLESHFAKCGRVVKASIMYDPHTHESRGFAFVEMKTAEEAQAAIIALNATELLGKPITVTKARRSRARTPTPGRYHGPPKKSDSDHPYRPRPYDSRYRDREDDYRRGRDDYDDRRRARGRYDDDYRRGDRYDNDYRRGDRYDDYYYRRDRDRDDRRDYDRARR